MEHLLFCLAGDMLWQRTEGSAGALQLVCSTVRIHQIPMEWEHVELVDSELVKRAKAKAYREDASYLASGMIDSPFPDVIVLKNILRYFNIPAVQRADEIST